MIDATDRTLLALLKDDSSQSYAALGEKLNLSAPAVFERVKKLRKSGVIRRSTVDLDGKKLGRPLLAYVHVTTEGWGKTPEMLALAEHPEVEELHSVTGDTCVLLKIRTESTKDLERLLKIVYDLPGVKGTRSYIVLDTYLERGAQP